MAKTKGRGSIYPLEKGKEKRRCKKWRLIAPCGYDSQTESYRQKTKTVELQSVRSDFRPIRAT